MLDPTVYSILSSIVLELLSFLGRLHSRQTYFKGSSKSVMGKSQSGCITEALKLGRRQAALMDIVVEQIAQFA